MELKVKIKDSWHERCYRNCRGYIKIGSERVLRTLEKNPNFSNVTVYLDNEAREKVIQFNKVHGQAYTITPSIVYNYIEILPRNLMDTE